MHRQLREGAFAAFVSIIFACTWFSCVATAIYFAGSRIRENKTFWWIQEKVTGCILVVLGLRLAVEKRVAQ
jgi:threonine/homoserine/homoserine lactone efflux protein